MLYFPKVSTLVIYYYRIRDIYVEIRVTLTYNGTGIQPPQTVLSIITTSVSMGTVSISYNFTFTASGTGSLTEFLPSRCRFGALQGRRMIKRSN